MKEEGIHEGCIEQIQRLFQDRLYNGSEVPVDEKEESELMTGKCVTMFRKK